MASIMATRQGDKEGRGEAGPPGPAGRRGKPGLSTSREQILSAVADQFAELRVQMDLQITRTGEVQAELDKQHRELVEVRKQLTKVHALLKKSLQV